MPKRVFNSQKSIFIPQYDPMVRFILLLFSSMLFFSCKDAVDTSRISSEVAISEEMKVNKLKQLDWLLGSWQNISEESTSKEIWRMEHDSLYVAESFTIANNDTVFYETIQLFQSGDEVFFKAKDAAQNNAKAVAFKLVPDEAGVFVFENKMHDFPKRIIYTNPTKDSIHAWIDGVQDGEFQIVDFYFERTK